MEEINMEESNIDSYYDLDMEETDLEDSLTDDRVVQELLDIVLLNDTTMLVRLKYPKYTYVSGILDVKAIRGCFEIMGYRLRPSSPAVTMYSLSEYYTMKITSWKEEASESCDTPFLRSMHVSEDLIEEIVGNNTRYTHVYVVRRNGDAVNLISYLRNFSFPSFAAEVDKSLITETLSYNRNSELQVDQKWLTMVDTFVKSMHGSKVLVCGGKGAGKSTFLRYLVNRNLDKWPEVLVLDFDIGQSEFTVMGCVSAVLIKEPLLGPNFTHLRTPVKSLFVGTNSALDCINFYYKCIAYITDFCHNHKQFKHIPWVVNTMGFTQGLGVSILHYIINCVKPDEVVQIRQENASLNFPGRVTPRFFSGNNLKPCYENYRVHLFDSLTRKSDGISVNKRAKKLEPFTCRNIAIMSYFRSAIDNLEKTDIFSAVPRKLNMSKVEIIVRKPCSEDLEMTLTRSQKLCCINARTVALCSSETNDLPKCLGFAVVRGFDMDTEEIYVVTPLTDEQLEKVTVIQMSSNIQLPQIVYTHQLARFGGPCPYLMYNTNPQRLSKIIRKTSSRGLELRRFSDKVSK